MDQPAPREWRGSISIRKVGGSVGIKRGGGGGVGGVVSSESAQLKISVSLT